MPEALTSAAFDYLRALHARQVRKETGIPYLSHLMRWRRS